MIGLTEQVFVRYQMKKEHEMQQIMHEQEMKRQIDQLREMRPGKLLHPLRRVK